MQVKALALLIALLFCIEPCFAVALDATVSEQTGEEQARIGALTDRILLELIDLERYYIDYRMYASREPPTRQTRYFVAQQAAAGLSLASSLVSMIEPAKHLSDPARVDSRVLKRGNHCGLVGVILQGGSSALELGSNTYTAVKNKVKGRDPASSLAEVKKRVASIDALRDKRDAAIEELTGSDVDSDEDYVADTPGGVAALYKLEGNLLKHLRDWCIFEISEVYADIKSYEASNSVYYALDTASAATYGASYAYTYKGYRRPEHFGHASIVGIVGDGIGIASAPASSWSYNYLYKRNKRRFDRVMSEKAVDAENICKKQIKALRHQVVGSDAHFLEQFGAVRTRMEVYTVWASRYDDYVAKHMIDLRHSDNVALQSNYAGPAISSAYLAQDIAGVITSYRYGNDLKKANDLTFAAAIPVTVAASASLALSTYWYVDHLRFKARLEREHATPQQLLTQRLKTLDDLTSLMRRQELDRKLPVQ